MYIFCVCSLGSLASTCQGTETVQVSLMLCTCGKWNWINKSCGSSRPPLAISWQLRIGIGIASTHSNVDGIDTNPTSYIVLFEKKGYQHCSIGPSFQSPRYSTTAHLSAIGAPAKRNAFGLVTGRPSKSHDGHIPPKATWAQATQAKMTMFFLLVQSPWSWMIGGFCVHEQNRNYTIP